MDKIELKIKTGLNVFKVVAIHTFMLLADLDQCIATDVNAYSRVRI